MSPTRIGDRGAFTEGQLRCAGRTIPYTIRHSARARWLRVTVRPEEGVVVTVPVGHDRRHLEDFLDRHGRWILHQVDRFASLASSIPKRWPYGSTLSYQGEERAVQLELAGQVPPEVQISDGVLLVRMRRPNVEGARRILKRWYQAEALRCCRQQAATLGERLGITYRSVKVRDQKRRWGSCSEKGGLNFNYRLIMAPPSVLEYVVLHELLHRLEPNHSSRFWSLVRAHCPTYRDAIAWLKTRGPYLSV